MKTDHLAASAPIDESWMPVQAAADLFGVAPFIVRHWINEGLILSEPRQGPNGPEPYVEVFSAATLPDQYMPGSGYVVGRDREIVEVLGALESASLGQGRLVLAGGPAGIGKTTLVNAARQMARAGGFSVLQGASYDVEHSRPFEPWHEMLHGFQPATIGPEPPPVLFEAETLQHAASPAHIYARVECFLRDLAEYSPLLLVLEDQHWADQPSLDLLRFLARRASNLSIAVFVTFRDDDLTPGNPLYLTLPRLVRESQVTRLNLQPLDEDSTATLMRQRYRLDEHDIARLAAFLQRYAEGNPFFIEELILHLEYEGALNRDDDAWVLGEIPEFRLPPLIRQIVAHRLDRLSANALRSLRIASVIGVEAPVDLWQQVTGSTSDELADVIDEALAAHLIVESATSASVQFRHALIREALYDGLQIIRRRAQHQRIAEVLAQDAQPNPALVAHHFQQARDRRAFDWLVLAGRQAALSFAYAPAIRQFEQAMSIIETDPGERANWAWLACELAVAHRYADPGLALGYVERAAQHAHHVDDPALHAVILLTRAHIRGFLGENALAELFEAGEALDALSDAEHKRIQETSLTFQVSQGSLAQRNAYYARYNEARSIAESVLQTERAPTTFREHYNHGTALIALGIAQANLGMPEDARAAFSRAREHLGQASYHFMIGTACAHEYRHLIEVYYPERTETRKSLLNLADYHFGRSFFAELSTDKQHERIYSALILDGRWGEARDAAEAFAGARYMLLRNSEVLAEMDMLQGFHERAWTRIDAAIPDGSSTEPTSAHFHEVINLQRIAAELALAQGQPELALDWIKALQRWRASTDSITGAYVSELLLARYHQATGDIAAALEHAHSAVRLAQHPRQPLGLMRAQRLTGHLAHRAGLHNEAARHLGVAIDLARAIQAPYETACCELVYADLQIDGNDRAGAREMLLSARQTLEQLAATPAIEQLASVEARLGDPASSSAPPAGLSAREIEVLRLVARGMTDAEIGAELFISRRTVSGHLQSIFNKCGVTSRAAATAFAYEHSIISTAG